MYDLFKKFDNPKVMPMCIHKTPERYPTMSVATSSQVSVIHNIKREPLGISIPAGTNNIFYFNLFDKTESGDLLTIATQGRFYLDLHQPSGEVVATVSSKEDDKTSGYLTVLIDEAGISIEARLRAGLNPNVYRPHLYFKLGESDTTYTLFNTTDGIIEVR